MKVRLRGLLGPFFEKSIDIPDGKTLIGREPDCQLPIQSGFISRYHCVLLLDEHTLRVRDLGSKNGTFVNGCRLSTNEIVLQQGDLLTVGEVSFQVDLGQRAAKVAIPGSEASRDTGPIAAGFNTDTVQAKVPPTSPESAAPPLPDAKPTLTETSLMPVEANPPSPPSTSK